MIGWLAQYDKGGDISHIYNFDSSDKQKKAIHQWSMTMEFITFPGILECLMQAKLWVVGGVHTPRALVA